ncbi:hypothetical protein MKW98_022170 [Papaver atlanticum]|uniref:Phytocyanin domain-containing protein n=1 Tax=Papaver atlanticum TaxID=357466 RepID=A0AAD4T610_9MAGN|nr:hypothetical protein MKW98_022170 [Papaver atlanticum]
MATQYSALSIFVVTMVMMVSLSSGNQFEVGGPSGWIIPPENDTQSYIEWASRTRFHIGDTVYFKYINDSVLVVNRNDYIYCNISNPIAKFEDGNTIFRFDRHGFFYFISGKVGHCKLGQRIVVRVMVHPSEEFNKPQENAPSSSPLSAGGVGSPSSDHPWGHPTVPNSTLSLSSSVIESYFMTTATVWGMVVVFLYVLM